MSGHTGKRKSSSGADTPSPTKKKHQGHSPGKAKKGKSEKARHTTPPAQTLTSSPPKTPKTPRSASKLGLKKETAKSLLKHGSKISPLYSMLHGFAQIVLEKKPENEDEFKPLLDELAGALVNTISVPGFFYSLTFRIPYPSTGRSFLTFQNGSTTPCAKNLT